MKLSDQFIEFISHYFFNSDLQSNMEPEHKMELEDKSIKKKFYEFNKNFNKDEFKKIDDKTFNFIDQCAWIFPDESTLIKVTAVLKHMKRSECREIKTYQLFNHTANSLSNQIHQLLKEINIPKLPKLQFLNLIECSITNIESISFLDAPYLKLICLERNRISNASSIHKWSFPHLRLINLGSNLIQEPTNHSRIKLNLITENYLKNINHQLKSKSTNFKNHQFSPQMRSIYKFNTKLYLPFGYNLEEDKILLNSLFIEDPSFFAKIEISSHLINHVKINQNGGNILKFDNKDRKLPCPFKIERDKRILEKESEFENKKNIMSGSRKFDEAGKEENIKSLKESLETEQSAERESEEEVKEEEVRSKKLDEESEFRYLDEEEREIMQELLLLNHLREIESFLFEDQQTGLNEVIEAETEANIKRITFKRIQQRNKINRISRRVNLTHYE